MEDLGRILLRPGLVAGPVQDPGSRFWPGHRVLTGSPDWPGSSFFSNQNDIVLVKKKKNQRVCNRVLIGFYRVNSSSQPGCTGFFLPLFFLQPGPVAAPGQPSSRSSFKTMLETPNLLFSWAKTLFVLVLYQSIRCTLLLFYVIVNF